MMYLLLLHLNRLKIRNKWGVVLVILFIGFTFWHNRKITPDNFKERIIESYQDKNTHPLRVLFRELDQIEAVQSFYIERHINLGEVHSSGSRLVKSYVVRNSREIESIMKLFNLVRIERQGNAIRAKFSKAYNWGVAPNDQVYLVWSDQHLDSESEIVGVDSNLYLIEQK